MKKIILAIFLALTGITGSTQVHINLTVGKSDRAPVMDFRVGAEVHQVVLDAVMISSIDRVNAAYFGTVIGYKIPVMQVSFTPNIGYYYKLISTDKKYLNGYESSLGIKIQYNIFSGLYYRMDGINFFTIGFIKRINDR